MVLCAVPTICKIAVKDLGGHPSYFKSLGGIWAKSGGTLAISKPSGGRLVILKVKGNTPAISKDMEGIATICRKINHKVTVIARYVLE